MSTKFALNNLLQKKRRKRKVASRSCLAHQRMMASDSVNVITTNNTVLTRKGLLSLYWVVAFFVQFCSEFITECLYPYIE